MAPVATNEAKQTTDTPDIKACVADKVFNPFYSPPPTDSESVDKDYKYDHFKVTAWSKS
jgi:hypothetical protein